MALLHWRKFSFFTEECNTKSEVNQLISNEKPQDISEFGATFVPIQITCSASGPINVLLGDSKGFVYIIDRSLKIIDSFKANQKCTSIIKQVTKSPIFITCGSDQEGINPLIKLWNLEKYDQFNQPSCIRVIRAVVGLLQPVPITCIECTDSLTFLIVGYEDGTIVTHYGDIRKQRKTRTIKPIRVSDNAITGIYLKEEIAVDSRSQVPGISLIYQNWAPSSELTAFLSTESEIYFLNLSEKSFSKTRLDTLGCKPECSCLISGPSGQANDSLFAVARDNAVYFYQADGRGPCLAFDGEKLKLFKMRGYLVVLSKDHASSEQATLRNRRPLSATNRINLNIYDINNKFIAHSSSVPDVQTVFFEWGELFLICNDGKVIIVKEKDTQSKLDILFKKNQFDLVIEIGKSHQNDEDSLTNIYKHYADHLYEKGDYDGAIVQYIKTIGRSEPSYVIKKFMDSQRISNLTIYLEALHERTKATQEHTKLLLNCYSKLENDHQLKQFIESYEEGNLNFDVAVAIKVLRNAGFYEFAIYLAKKHKLHDLFFKIQMQDINDSLGALEYLNKMDDIPEIVTFLKKYGRVMLNDAPDNTIELIKTVCVKSKDAEVISHTKTPTSNSNFEDVVRSSRIVYPEDFFHLFVDRNGLFVQLLEQLVRDGSEFATVVVHNILLELYLSAWAHEDDNIMKIPIRDKIMKLLSLPNEKYDLDQAFILCKTKNFEEGLIFLYNRAELYNLILEHYIQQDDGLKVLTTCEQFGSKDPSLYLRSLGYFAKKDDERLGQILKVIEHQNIVSPLKVISIILESDTLSLGPIKEYMIRVLNATGERIYENSNEIDHFKDDTELIKEKLEEFENHQTVFKPSVCSACKSDLDLPSVHFFCSHSYHQSCFHNYSAESEECPICVINNTKLLEEINSHETRKSNFGMLNKQLTTSGNDPFSTLTKLFGYGLF